MAERWSGRRRVWPLLLLFAASASLAGCTEVYRYSADTPVHLAATYVTLPGSGMVRVLPAPPPSSPYGHDGVYAGHAQALFSAGAQCSGYRTATDFRVEGRRVRFGPFNGTIGPEGGLQMIYGQNRIVGQFDDGRFSGVITYQVPPCSYAILLKRQAR